MTGKRTLMTRLDAAAEKLLDHYFPEDAKWSKGTDQIKAFDAVVKYFGPRTKQNDELKESPFDQLRSGLNGGAASRRPRRKEKPADEPDDAAADA